MLLTPKIQNKAILVLVIVAAAEAFLLFQAGRKTKQLELYYKNPARIESKKINTSKGGYRVVYRTLQIPGKPEVTTEKIIEQEPDVILEETAMSQKPVPPPDALAAHDENKWLVGGAVGTRARKTILVGYGFRNRIDLLAGAGRSEGRVEPQAQVVIRF